MDDKVRWGGAPDCLAIPEAFEREGRRRQSRQDSDGGRKIKLRVYAADEFGSVDQPSVENHHSHHKTLLVCAHCKKEHKRFTNVSQQNRWSGEK